MCVCAREPCVCMFIRELGGAGLFGESPSEQVRVGLAVSLGSALMEFNPDPNHYQLGCFSRVWRARQNTV